MSVCVRRVCVHTRVHAHTINLHFGMITLRCGNETEADEYGGRGPSGRDRNNPRERRRSFR